MLLAFILAFLVQTQLVQLWHVFVLAGLLGIINALDLPAQQAFLGDLTGMAEVRKAVNLNGMALQGSRTLGPVFAGFLIAKIGNAPAFWLNGLSFLAVVVSLMAVRAQQTRRASSHGGALMQIGEALQFLRTQPRLQDMFFFMAMLTMFYWSIVLNLLPSVASEVLGGDAATFGSLQSASGLGAVIGLIFVVPLAQAGKRSGWILGAAALWVGVGLMGFSVARTLEVAFVTLFMASVAAPVIFTISIGLTQVMAPPEMRARLISLFTMISFGLQPLAALAVGALAERVGVQPVIQFNATMIVIGAAAILTLRTDLRTWVSPQPGTTPVPLPAEVGLD
ncbi:MAG: MFS transporter, partial [Armatimonadetes bacterium]|nr:MFS transporter [Anaerolineae bacterium]